MTTEENNKSAKTEVLNIPPHRSYLLNKDIGKLFWRVEYQGILTQYKISEVFDNGKGRHELATLTDLSDGYTLKNEVKYWGSSEFGLDTIKKDEFYTNFTEAKKASKARYDKEVNPNGDYRVARYFDDIFEAWESGILIKKEANKISDELNRQERYYVRYDTVDVTKDLESGIVQAVINQIL